jgi:hypothetical protein
MLQQDFRKKQRDRRRSVLLLRLSLFGLITSINPKETGHNLDAKAVTESSNKKKQCINT